MQKKTAYITGPKVWSRIFDLLAGWAVGLMWVFPALFSGEPGFLWGAPLTMGAVYALGESKRKKAVRVDIEGLKAMRQVDASLDRIETMAKSPLFSDDALAASALKEALVAREEFLEKCSWLREIKESGVFNTADIRARESQVSSLADGIFDLEASLKSYLRESENSRHDSRKAAEEVLSGEMDDLRDIYTAVRLKAETSNLKLQKGDLA